jgi:anti-sigma regulatory factor (Ser/Thr protein kinase)
MATQTVLGSWPAQAATVPEARRAVRQWLHEQHLDVHVDAAQLVVSELVGNVVLHVGGVVELRASRAGEEVLLEVSDGSAVLPHTRVFSSTSSTGRGMRLVHSLSAAHGVSVTPGGKTVWVRLTADTAARSDDELSSQFSDVDWLAQAEPDADSDVVVLARPESRTPAALRTAA